MDIKILGPGCSRCASLRKRLSMPWLKWMTADVKKVKDIQEIMSYKIMSTPALVVNGKVKVAGKVPKREEIKRYIKEELV